MRHAGDGGVTAFTRAHDVQRRVAAHRQTPPDPDDEPPDDVDTMAMTIHLAMSA
jgi:hypothetical protein